MLLEPYPLPRWVRLVAAVDDRVSSGWLTAPTPRCLRWLDRLEDRAPVWALPWLVTGLMAALPGLAFGLPAILRRLR